jgi:hypothetical protein
MVPQWWQNSAREDDPFWHSQQHKSLCNPPDAAENSLNSIILAIDSETLYAAADCADVVLRVRI